MSASLPVMSFISAIALVISSRSALSQTYLNNSPLTQESCYCLRHVIGQIKNPVSVIFYLDGKKERVLVVEQVGMVSRYETDGTRIDTFMDIRDRVVISDAYGDSRGLLSLVLDPAFDVTRNVYAYYIRSEEGREYAYVSMFNARLGLVDPMSEKFLLRIYQPYIHGNGGPMLFGDDGYLYMLTGDGGEEDDRSGRAQNLNTFHGKVLRIDVKNQSFTEGESGVALMYTVPKSNPFINVTNARDEVFAFGIRNMWGCSQDSTARLGGTGRIFCAETGTSKFDEINLIESGRNYGWNLVEGTECLNSSGCSSIDNEGRPIYEFTHESTHALVGGYVYRGEEFTHMAGHYVYGDVITGKTYFLEENSNGKWASFEWDICEPKKCPPNARESRLKHILGFGQDRKGDLYLLMTDDLVATSDTGMILKMVPPNSSTADMTPIAALVIGCAAIIASRTWME